LISDLDQHPGDAVVLRVAHTVAVGIEIDPAFDGAGRRWSIRLRHTADCGQ
jgi:hypothetical protein